MFFECYFVVNCYLRCCWKHKTQVQKKSYGVEGCCFLSGKGGNDRLEFSEECLQKVEKIFQVQLLKLYFFKKKLINLMFKNVDVYCGLVMYFTASSLRFSDNALKRSILITSEIHQRFLWIFFTLLYSDIFFILQIIFSKIQ